MPNTIEQDQLIDQINRTEKALARIEMNYEPVDYPNSYYSNLAELAELEIALIETNY